MESNNWTYFSGIKKNNRVDFRVLLVLGYYWILSNLMKFEELDSISIFIFLQFPVILFVIAQLSLFRPKNINNINLFFLIFLGVVILVNTARGEFSLILSTAIDILPAYIILANRRAFISLKFINMIFVAQIIIAVISYYLNANSYGFLPGQSIHPEFFWKISLFSYLSPPYTGAFAFLVFLANAEKPGKRKMFDIMVIVLALYFVMFSGSRTIYLICGFYFLLTLVRRFIPMNKWPVFYFMFPVVFLFALIASAFMGQLVQSTHNELLDSIFVRNVKYADYRSIEDLDRYIMWKQYLDIFMHNWLLGAGKIDKSKYFSETVGTGETWFGLMLAFHGIVYFIFVIAIFKIMISAIKRNLGLAYVGIVAFLIICIFYGSYMRGYSMIWLLFFALIADEFNTSSENQRRVNIYNSIILKAESLS
ncbi:hypothetical protein GO495_15910 [Chitinophaga oryziterrae]|uniref:O-antigen ligase-related domain-containing protein n=1 Tax=Chitinophaga oryziterrae TaxID=1031224 RepID=A0A6N8JA06_9BACT|nr:O-antigen ligase family protein [Chitinophaga oryziterrae]MVT42077.1 hypothetical protein [Chitinophaga oryziterrae]